MTWQDEEDARVDIVGRLWDDKKDAAYQAVVSLQITDTDEIGISVPGIVDTIWVQPKALFAATSTLRGWME